MHRSWPARSALEELRIELDQPIDYAIAGWMAPPPVISLAFDPGDPRNALPAAYVEAHRHWEPATLILVAVLGCLGLALWFEGMTVLLGEGMPFLLRAFISILLVLTLPWWGEYFPSAITQLNAQWAAVIGDILADTQRVDRVVAFTPDEATLADGERLAWRSREGTYKDTFGRLAFTPPAPAPPSADAALAALVDAVTQQVRAMTADDRTALFARLREDKRRDLRAAGIVFLPAAKEAALATGADGSLRRAATAFLSNWLTQPIDEPNVRDAAYRERVHLYAILADVPIPEISISAASFAEAERSKR
jgi:hypothetical protein